MVSVTDSDLATCSGTADVRDGGVSNLCRPSQDEAEYLCYFMHRLLDFRHPEISSLVSLLDSRDNQKPADFKFELPCGGSYLSPFWYVRLPSEALAKTIAQRSLLVKVHRRLMVYTIMAVSFGLIFTQLAGLPRAVGRRGNLGRTYCICQELSNNPQETMDGLQHHVQVCGGWLGQSYQAGRPNCNHAQVPVSGLAGASWQRLWHGTAFHFF